MHSTYYFSLRLPEGTDAGQALMDAAVEVFEAEFANRRCDENNWYHPLMVVDERGRVAVGANEDTSSFRPTLAELRTRARQAVLYEAVFYAASDERVRSLLPDLNPVSLGPRGSEESMVEAMGDEELDALLRTRLSQALALDYDQLAARSGHDAESDMLGSYRRQRLSGLLERYLSAGEHAPFADSGTPYEYCAFNLDWSGEGIEAILLVDIHT